MKAIFLAAILLASATHHTASAGGSHHGSIDEPMAIQIALGAVPQLASKDFGFEVGKLESSWSDIDEKDVTVVETDGDFYVVSAANPGSEATIYFLIAANGQVADVKNTNDF